MGRVYQAFQRAGTAQARADAISAVINTMGSAPTIELLFATYLRESAAGRAAAALPILRLVRDMAPGDPEIAYLVLNAEVAGRSVPDQIAARKAFALQFPTHAAVHNTLAYQIATTDPQAALAEVGEYVRLLPNHPNAHDSFADLLLLAGRPAEAFAHVQREMAIDSTFTQAYMKTGVIKLTLGDVTGARADFASGAQRFGTGANGFNFRQWTMATYVAAGDGRGALREMGASLSVPELTPAINAAAHERFATLEAYFGDRTAVAGHLSAVMTATPTPVAAHYAVRAIALARIGELDQARSAAAQYRSMAPAAPLGNTVDAYVALAANDLATAGSWLSLAAPNDLLARALRADLAMRSGARADAAALRQQVLSSTLKQDGNPPLDFFKLIARMHADRLRPAA
jgi:Flp pilus assembly protein TadD